MMFCIFQAKYVTSNGLLGASFWALDLDDFKESCGSTSRFPLLQVVNKLLNLHAEN